MAQATSPAATTIRSPASRKPGLHARSAGGSPRWPRGSPDAAGRIAAHACRAAAGALGPVRRLVPGRRPVPAGAGGLRPAAAAARGRRAGAPAHGPLLGGGVRAGLVQPRRDAGLGAERGPRLRAGRSAAGTGHHHRHQLARPALALRRRTQAGHAGEAARREGLECAPRPRTAPAAAVRTTEECAMDELLIVTTGGTI